MKKTGHVNESRKSALVRDVLKTGSAGGIQHQDGGEGDRSPPELFNIFFLFVL